MKRAALVITAILLVGLAMTWLGVKHGAILNVFEGSTDVTVLNEGNGERPDSMTIGSVTSATLHASKTPSSVRAVPVIKMPEMNREELIEMGRRIDEKRGKGVFRFAKPINVAISPMTDGVWETAADGSDRWRVRINSPGAISLNLGFSQYKMPEGGRLSIFPPEAERDRPIRDFTAADNEDHGQLWTPLLFSDELVLEVTLPPNSRDLLALKVARVNHGFRKHADDKANGNNRSGRCNIDVACTSDPTVGPLVQMYANQIRSVGAYTLSGVDTCSGALINNTANDATPYFLTAEHCEIDSDNAASMVVYFNFENSICRTPGSPESGQPGDGTLTQFNTGAIFRANYEPSDFCLVELDDPVPTAYNVFYAGWDRSGANGMAAGIHHPDVAEKRISFELDDTVDSGGTHVEVTDWDYGTTEGGSSGSPLFDAAGRIIGDLTGGDAACGNDGYDEYGRLSVSWNGGGSSASRLSDWLDPLNSGTTAIDGINQDDALSIDNVSITEGNSGTQTLQFTVSLARESNDTITVQYATADGTAFAPDDYVSTSSTLTFGPSESSKTISVTIIGDTAPEENESFEVFLSSPSNAQIADGTGVATIINDDFIPPEISSSLTASGAEGAAFTYKITALNTPTSFSIINEPAGMTVNATTGDISWTPLTTGQFSVTIGADNSAGSDTELLVIDVGDSQLKQGLDQNRSFTESTNLWLLETTTTHDGIDSAKSPSIKNDQTAFFETQITAPAGGETVTFWWKVSSEETYDFLRFRADGNLIDEISGEQDWIFFSHFIAAGQTETLRWEYVKDESVSEGNDAGYIDELIIASDEMLPVFSSPSSTSGVIGQPFFFDVNAVHATSFAATTLPPGLNFNSGNGEITGIPTGPIGSSVTTITATNANGSRDQNLTIAIVPTIGGAVDDDEGKAVWSTNGDADWFGQFATTFDGSDAAESGNISHDETSTLRAVVNFDGAQNLSFRWKVSSELDYDELIFAVDGSNGVAPISGEIGWVMVQNVTIPSGPATLSWSFVKDESESHGADTGWVDDVRFSYLLGAVTNLSANGQAPGGGTLVSWNAVSNAQSYRVYRSTVDDPATASLIASPATTNYTDFSAVAGTPYFYWVRAHSASTQLGAPGGPVGATALNISPPTNVSATNLEFPDKIGVTWNAVAGAENYRVYRGTVDDFSAATEVAQVSSGTTDYNDTAATPTPDVYYYWVTSTETIDSTETESDPSNSSWGRRAADIHGDTAGAATAVSVQSSGSASVSGTLQSGDIDFFTFTLTAPTGVRIYTTGNLDTIGTLTDSGSNVQNDPNADDDAGDGANFRSEVLLIADAFTIEVALAPGSDHAGSYTLRIELDSAGQTLPVVVANSALNTVFLKKIKKVKKSIKRAKKGSKRAKAKKLKTKLKKLKKRFAAF